MIAGQLKVYEETYKMVQLLMVCQKQFDRQFKYTLGERIQDTALGLFECIQRANMYREHRVRNLEDFLIKFETLKTLLSLAYDFKQIGTKRQAEIYNLTETIGRQVSAWKNASRKKAHLETTDGIDERLRESTNGGVLR